MKIDGFDVPIVGRDFTAHEGVVMALVTCNCQPGNRPMLLRGHDLGAVCMECGRVYQIVAARFDRKRGDAGPQVAVALVGRQPIQAKPAPPAPGPRPILEPGVKSGVDES